MNQPDRTFAVASDDALASLIASAKQRLVVIAPALSKPTADALVKRFEELDRLDVRVILDVDAEVYRLGFGDPLALAAIREAAAKSLLDLREQPGVRIGVVIADDDMMVFAPVSKNIEAGSTSIEKPNAILLKGAPAARIAEASGATNSDAAPPPEIGQSALIPDKVEAMVKDLDRNPPARFDITRKLNVFSSRVVFIEFEMKNSSLSRKQVKLPDEFKAFKDKSLKDGVEARIKAPLGDIGKVKVNIGTEECENVKDIDEKWLSDERKRIVDRYTFQINNFGRVILRDDRDDFETAITAFREVVARYQEKVKEAVKAKREEFVEAFVAEFLPLWEESPPEHMTRWRMPTDTQSLTTELRKGAESIFDETIDFVPPTVRLVEKNVSPKNVADQAFLGPLRQIMEKRGAPKDLIDSLFASGDAAPETGRLC